MLTLLLVATFLMARAGVDALDVMLSAQRQSVHR